MRRPVRQGGVWRLVLLGGVVCLMVGCGQRPPVPHETMEEVLADIYLVDAMVPHCDSLSKLVDDKKLAPYQEVLAKHGLTQELLDSAMEYYLSRRGAYDDLLGNVITRLQVLQQALIDSVHNQKMVDGTAE